MNRLVFRFIIIIFLSFSSLTVFAQQKKVAVYVTGQQTGISKVLGDKLVEAFAKSGKYIAIERTSSFLAELSKEQNYQRTGAVDDNELSRLGKQFGVQLVCVADISEVFGQKYVSARLINVESAEVVNTSNTNSNLDNMGELLKVADKIAKELTDKTVQEKAEEALAKQQECAETEKMLIDGFAKGYIKAGNLYATITFTYIHLKEIPDIVKSCRVGGFTDWRIPTVTELNVVKQACKGYYVERECFSQISSDKLEQLKYISGSNSNFNFWVENGYVVGSNGTYFKGIKNSYKLMLVRDAK